MAVHRSLCTESVQQQVCSEWNSRW